MKQAGGLIAIIAGCFGVFGASTTLLISGVGSLLEADNYRALLNVAWGGFGFSFLSIILGALTIRLKAKSHVGTALMLTSMAGFFAGGMLVGIFMVLSFAGGLIAMFHEADPKEHESIITKEV